MKILLLRALTLGFLAMPATASATDVKFLLCFPGGPGSTADAQPVVDAFLKALAGQAGWGSASGTYTNDLAQCQSGAGGAGVVVLPLDLYLQQHTAWRLTPVATLTNKETASRYHVVTKKGTTLDALKGKPVSTAIPASDAFLSRVGFDGKLDVSKDIALSRVRTALKALKDLDKGVVSAVLLDDVQQKALAGLPFAASLETVLSGAALPGAIVASVGAVQGLGPALTGLCSKATKVCDDMRITGFQPIDAAALAALGKKLTP